MGKVTIEIDSKWVKIVHSPVYWIVVTLQGLSISFAPLFLYWCGKGTLFHGTEWLFVPLCFGIIFFVGFFYMALGGAVIGQLRKKDFSA